MRVSASYALLGTLLSQALARLPGPAFHKAALKFRCDPVVSFEHPVEQPVYSSAVCCSAQCLSLCCTPAFALNGLGQPGVCTWSLEAEAMRSETTQVSWLCVQVASRSGDMRRALEACSLALDILAAEAAKQLHAVSEDAGAAAAGPPSSTAAVRHVLQTACSLLSAIDAEAPSASALLSTDVLTCAAGSPQAGPTAGLQVRMPHMAAALAQVQGGEPHWS